MMTARGSNRAQPHAAQLHPFGIIHRIGLSQAGRTRLDRYRRKRERQGAVLVILSWVDGTWCALALHTRHLPVAVLGDEQKAAAYHEARALIESCYLPLLALRFDSNA